MLTFIYLFCSRTFTINYLELLVTSLPVDVQYYYVYYDRSIALNVSGTPTLLCSSTLLSFLWWNSHMVSWPLVIAFGRASRGWVLHLWWCLGKSNYVEFLSAGGSSVSMGYTPQLVVLNTNPLALLWRIVFNWVTCFISLGMSTALGHPRPLNSMLVRSLKKLSTASVDTDLSFMDILDRAKISILVEMPCNSDSYICTSIPLMWVERGGISFQLTSLMRNS